MERVCCCCGLVISAHAFYCHVLSSYPDEVYGIFLKILIEKIKNNEIELNVNESYVQLKASFSSY